MTTSHSDHAQQPTKTTVTPSWKDAAAGAGAGAFSRTVTAPIERIKLILQLQHSIRSTTPETTTTNNNIKPTTAMQAAKQIYKNEGFLSFWRGNWPSVLRVSGTAAINFSSMNYYKETLVHPLLHSHNLLTDRVLSHLSPEQAARRRKNMGSFLAGGMAGGTATTLLYPIEFLRTRLTADLAQQGKKNQSGHYQFRGMRDATVRILRSDGILGFFQGYGIALFGGIYYRVLFLGGYDVLKSEMEHYNAMQAQNNNNNDFQNNAEQQQQQFTSSSDTSTLTWSQRIMIAQTISLGAGTLSYPLDSVRRRLMMQAGVAKDQRKYRHSLHCISVVFQEEGLRGFFLGLGPNIVRSVSGALLLVAYDGFKAAMSSSNN